MVLGSWEIIEAIIFYNPLIDSSISGNNELLYKIISSVDLFLIAIVLLIFGFGIYELFVSEIDFTHSKFKNLNIAKTATKWRQTGSKSGSKIKLIPFTQHL